MDSDDDNDDSRESQQSSEEEGGDHSPAVSDGSTNLDAENTELPSNFSTTATTTTAIVLPQNRTLQPFADECKSYDIVPYVAAIHSCHIHSLDATRNMRWVFTGGEDGFIRKYDFFASISGKTLLTQNQKHAQVESAGVISSYWENEEIPVNPKPVVNGTGDENTIQPDPPEYKLSPVYSLAVQSEAVWILSGLESGAINLFSVRHEEGRCHHVMRKHKSPVSILKITHDEKGFVSGSWDKTVLLWDLNTGQVVREFGGHLSQISSLAFRPIEKVPPWCLSACWSADGNKIYCGRRNGTGKFIRSLKMPSGSGPVSYVSSMPNGKHIIW
ncbi:7308_t:CDS:10 [Diversispora eburnea]|uniref:7308_t:CDS:1 n=1 Tax=Diversispora eburnea TaxID=1213867 RepID=A0A9N9AGH2_9GLOM|nr:7308_t:CDS:10 [Diversispora eburnea]